MASTTNPRQLTPKQPPEYLDYDFDLSRRLAPSDDTIVAATVTCDDDSISLGDTQVSSTVVKQWLGGGTSGVTYHLVCMATTDQGRTLEEDMFVKVKEI